MSLVKSTRLWIICLIISALLFSVFFVSNNHMVLRYSNFITSPFHSIDYENHLYKEQKSNYQTLLVKPLQLTISLNRVLKGIVLNVNIIKVRINDILNLDIAKMVICLFIVFYLLAKTVLEDPGLQKTVLIARTY